MSDAATYPLVLDLAGRRAVVVGGGPVAARRARRPGRGRCRRACSSRPWVCEDLRDLVEAGRRHLAGRATTPAATSTAPGWCTPRPATRRTDDLVAAHAEGARVWCVRADDASLSAAWTPAVARAGDVTVAVTAGGDPRRATTAARRGRARPGHRRAAAAPPPPGRHRARRPGRRRPGRPRADQRARPAAARRGRRRAGRPAGAARAGRRPRPDGRRRSTSARPPGTTRCRRRRSTGCSSSTRQAGRRVVRLKGGDPFVLGRGGEEALACLAAGVPVEVVPGVTSAIAVPAHAGIPVTHRGRSRQVTIASGHEGLDWASLAAARGHPRAADGGQPAWRWPPPSWWRTARPPTPRSRSSSRASRRRSAPRSAPSRRSPTWPASATCSRRPSSSIGDVVDLHAVLGLRHWADAPPLVAVAHGSRDPAAAAATRSLLAAVRTAAPGPDRARGLPRPRAAPAEPTWRVAAARRPVRRRAAAARRGLPQPGRHPGRPRAGSGRGDAGRRPGAGPAAAAPRWSDGSPRPACRRATRTPRSCSPRPGRPTQSSLDGGARPRRGVARRAAGGPCRPAFASAAEPSVEEAVADLRAARRPAGRRGDLPALPRPVRRQAGRRRRRRDRRAARRRPRGRRRSSSPATTPPPVHCPDRRRPLTAAPAPDRQTPTSRPPVALIAAPLVRATGEWAGCTGRRGWCGRRWPAGRRAQPTSGRRVHSLRSARPPVADSSRRGAPTSEARSSDRRRHHARRRSPATWSGEARRFADLSQRELARRAVGAAEHGRPDRVRRGRGAAMGHGGRPAPRRRLPPAAPSPGRRPVRRRTTRRQLDRADRRYPAHLDVRPVQQFGSWWGDWPYLSTRVQRIWPQAPRQPPGQHLRPDPVAPRRAPPDWLRSRYD